MRLIDLDYMLDLMMGRPIDDESKRYFNITPTFKLDIQTYKFMLAIDTYKNTDEIRLAISQLSGKKISFILDTLVENISNTIEHLNGMEDISPIYKYEAKQLLMMYGGIIYFLQFRLYSTAKETPELLSILSYAFTNILGHSYDTISKCSDDNMVSPKELLKEVLETIQRSLISTIDKFDNIPGVVLRHVDNCGARSIKLHDNNLYVKLAYN